MDRVRSEDSPQQPDNFLSGGGEMGARIRAFDWSTTPLGPARQWPQSLRSSVSMMLPSKAQIVLFWGPELVALYNDAYREIFGSKHPWALGQPASECWSEIWDVLGPLLMGVVKTGEAFWAQDHPFFLERQGYLEETYFDVSYDPVRDESGEVGGVFCIVRETTKAVLGERRLQTLRDLAARSAEARTEEEVCRQAAATLAANPYDIPFSLLYLIDETGESARLAGVSGIDADLAATPRLLDLASPSHTVGSWPFADIMADRRNLPQRFGPAIAKLSDGPWPQSPTHAVILPLARAGQESSSSAAAGFLIVGVNPRRALDDEYQGFFALVAGQVATAIGNARVYEEERKRAEALAEVDRAKTTFFSNVSHEFRTPLTLMLGPLEEVLADGGTPPQTHERIAVAHRNSLRLLKLVNMLLDFSRIEADRIQAMYEPLDLATFTAELASLFRAAIEKAGMKLVVDCPPLDQLIYVDREMWEKIVLNLLSNAFKFTFDGEIKVTLRQTGEMVELSVGDTGTGIPEVELPHLFERFHRVKGARGRSYEGSGIGLALVQELVRLHGGSVGIESEVDRGSTFIVRLPTGRAHLPADRVGVARPAAASGSQSEAYVEEAMRWLPDSDSGVPIVDFGFTAAEAQSAAHDLRTDDHQTSLQKQKSRILLADDNTDMREYMRRLLAANFEIETVADGEAAIEAARKRAPDLILTDVMMPKVDGFGVIQALRADERTATIPVILLSARAGEASRIEGLEAGANDYLVKPFSARELLARVEAHLNLQRVRQEAERAVRQRTTQFETLLNQAPVGVYLVDGDFRIRQVNPAALPAFGDIPNLIGRDFDEVIHILWTKEYADEIVRLFRHTLETGEPYVAPERTEYRLDRGGIESYEWRIDRIALPDARPDKHYGVVCYFRDISEQVFARQAIIESEEKYRTVLTSMDEGFLIAEVLFDEAGEAVDYRCLEVNPAFYVQTGLPTNIVGMTMREIAPDTPIPWLSIYGQVVKTRAAVRFEFDIEVEQLRGHYDIYILPLGKPEEHRVAVLFQNITERKRAEEDARFLSDLSEQIRLTDDVDQLLSEATTMVGQYLHLNRCYISETDVERDRWWVSQDYHAGVSSIAGEYRVSDYPPYIISDARAGRLMISEDAKLDPRSADFYEAAYAPIGIRAHIVVPLLRESRWVANLVAATSEPRRWQQREIALLETLVERLWLAVERLRAENATREAQARRLAEEQRAREAAEYATHAKDEFLAMVSHELRSPLNAILGWVRVLRTQHHENPEINKIVDTVERHGRAQNRLIEDLLDTARIISGKLRLEIGPVAIDQVIVSALDTVRPAAESKGIITEVALDPTAGQINGDPERLQQVVWNLLLNAVKFTPSGGRVRIALSRVDSAVQIAVSDTGKGIGADLLPHVFDRFRQDDSSASRRFGGLGLGLALVKHLVELHGGDVSVESPGEGQGSTFTVLLPARAVQSRKDAPELIAPPTMSRSATSIGTYRLDGVRVLAVDDDEAARQLIAFLLQPYGALVSTASSAADALKAIDNQIPDAPFDILVSDIGMPDVDGYELIQRVRAHADSRVRSIRAVALTAYTRYEDRLKALRAGYHMHVPKPFEKDELLIVVASLAGRLKQ